MTPSAWNSEWISAKSLHSVTLEAKPILEDISILVPTLGRPILEKTLYRILMGSAWPRCLIVVEQGSNEDVAGWLERLQELGVPAIHIVSDQRGKSAGLNLGLGQVVTKFVAITDDDCFVRDDWLFNMANRLRQNPEAVVTGRVEAAGEEMTIVVTSTELSIQRRPRIKFDTMSGGNMGAALDIFRKAGLFDEDPVLMIAEDAEWSYRVLRHGVPIVYDPDVVIWHYGWRDAEKRYEQYYRYAMCHGGFFGKYLRRGDLFILVRAILHFFRALRRWVLGSVKGKTDDALNGRAYCLGLIPGIAAGFRSRVRVGKLK